MNQEEKPRPSWDDRERGQRSFFWPVLLIGVGVVLLLSQLGLIAPVSWLSLIRYWPVLLIVAGLDLLLGRRAPILGSLLGLLVLAAILGLLLWGPATRWTRENDWSLGLPGLEIPTKVRHSHFEEPIAQAQEAKVILDLGPYPSQIVATSDDTLLFEADVDYLGQMRFETTGKATRTILLDEVRSGINLNTDTSGQHRWNVGLSPEIPLDLTVDVGSGSAELYLEALPLTELAIDGGSGALALSLPFGYHEAILDLGSGPSSIDIPEGAHLAMELETGSGSVDLELSDAVDLDLTVVDAGSGPLTLEVPEDAAVRLRVRDDGSGPVQVPSGMVKVRGSADSKEGIWETVEFDRASHQISVDVYDMGSGSLRLQLAD